MLASVWSSWVVLALLGEASVEDPPDSSRPELVETILLAAGGEESLLTCFRMRERFNAGTSRNASGPTRESFVCPPEIWWIGKKERGTEPAKIVAWVWTLKALIDPRSRIEDLRVINDINSRVAGVRISGSVDPPLDAYFDAETFRLARIDWRDDVYRFSEWKTVDGFHYPSLCVMYRRKSLTPWFFHEILELERLHSLPQEAHED